MPNPEVALEPKALEPKALDVKALRDLAQRLDHPLFSGNDLSYGTGPFLTQDDNRKLLADARLAAKAIRAYLAAAPAGVEGWRLVPVEPTERMIGAYITGVKGAGPKPAGRMRDLSHEDWYKQHREKFLVRWKGVLAAAPEPASVVGVVPTRVVGLIRDLLACMHQPQPTARPNYWHVSDGKHTEFGRIASELAGTLAAAPSPPQEA